MHIIYRIERYFKPFFTTLITHIIKVVKKGLRPVMPMLAYR